MGDSSIIWIESHLINSNTISKLYEETVQIEMVLRDMWISTIIFVKSLKEYITLYKAYLILLQIYVWAFYLLF